jgi:Protein of unknown function (DUF4238)
MGHHYVPRAYLKGFTDPAERERIWAYNKIERNLYPTSIRKAAQETRFYSEDDEIALNSEIESPANPVLEKLRKRMPADDSERLTLANYLAVMLTRVPAHRAESRRQFPGVLEETFQELMAFTSETPRDLDTASASTDLARLLPHLKAAYATTPPEALVNEMERPRLISTVRDCIYNMTWRLLVCLPGSSLRYVTTDNPFFFFRGYGLADRLAEFSFPVSSQACLHGSWTRTDAQDNIFQVPERFVREMNRRNISSCTRFIFYHERADWIAKLAHKEPYLSQIQWSAITSTERSAIAGKCRQAHPALRRKRQL